MVAMQRIKSLHSSKVLCLVCLPAANQFQLHFEHAHKLAAGVRRPRWCQGHVLVHPAPLCILVIAGTAERTCPNAIKLLSLGAKKKTPKTFSTFYRHLAHFTDEVYTLAMPTLMRSAQLVARCPWSCVPFASS